MKRIIKGLLFLFLAICCFIISIDSSVSILTLLIFLSLTFLFFGFAILNLTKKKPTIKTPDKSILIESTKGATNTSTQPSIQISSSIKSSENAELVKIDANTTYTTARSSVHVSSSSITPKSPLKRIARFVVLDVETTGISSSDSIVEIGMLKFENHRLIDSYSQLVDPGFHIPSRATKIHGITDKMVFGKPSFASIFPSVRAFVGDFPIVGHNVSFDIRMIVCSGGEDISETRTIFDTLSISRRHISCDNHKLSTLCAYFGIAQDSSHRSVADCEATARLFHCLYEEITGKHIPVTQCVAEETIKEPANDLPD